jgi:type I restriction enzyme S subunit
MTTPTLHASQKTKKTAIGEIPVDWCTRELGEICKIVSGGTPHKAQANYWSGSIPWFSAKDLKKFRLTDSIDTISAEGAAANCRLVPGNTVLILVRGMTLNKDVPVGITMRESAFNQDLKALLPNDSVSTEFLAYALAARKKHLLALVDRSGHGTGRLQTELLESFLVALPPLPEQGRIAALLGTWERAIERQEQLLTTKQQYNQGLMQQLLTGKQRFKRFAGEEWKTYRLSDLLERVFRPVTLSDDAALDLISIRRRAGGLFFRGSFTAREFKTLDLNRIETGDFLVSKRQVTHGALAMVRQPFDGMHVSNEYVIFRSKAPEKLYMPFLDWLSRSQRMWHMAYLASNGVHIEKLIFDAHDFLKEKIAIPPSLEEQQQIVDLLETSDTEMRLLTQELTAMKDQKRGMMQKLLTGKVRVRA